MSAHGQSQVVLIDLWPWECGFSYLQALHGHHVVKAALLYGGDLVVQQLSEMRQKTRQVRQVRKIQVKVYR